MAERQRSLIQVRLTPEGRDRVKAPAKRERRTVSAWVRALVLDELDALERKPSVTGEHKRKRSGK